MKFTAAAVPVIDQSQINALAKLSARIGRDPLLAQASSGNASLKVDGTLWVKASGKWLADADRDEIFVPVDLAECLQSFRRGDSIAALDRTSWATDLRPSVETFMHAVLPKRVVIHVHSVNTIALAVRSDASLQLANRLFGLNWCWIPYVSSGFPLAREIRILLRRNRKLDVFVLGNHGLVVCGSDCQSVESLLFEVERRLATLPRVVPQAKFSVLKEIQRVSAWRLPPDKMLHTLGTDGNSRRVVEAGVLYPCQAVLLGGMLPMISRDTSFYRVRKQLAALDNSRFLIVERSGVLIREDATAAELAAFHGYAEVVRRIEASAPLRCLTNAEVKSVLAVRDQARTSSEPDVAALVEA